MKKFPEKTIVRVERPDVAAQLACLSTPCEDCCGADGRHRQCLGFLKYILIFSIEIFTLNITEIIRINEEMFQAIEAE